MASNTNSGFVWADVAGGRVAGAAVMGGRFGPENSSGCIDGSGAKMAAGPRWIPLGCAGVDEAGSESGTGTDGGAGTSMWMGVNEEDRTSGSFDRGATASVEGSSELFVVGGAIGTVADVATGEGQAGGAKAPPGVGVPASIASKSTAP